MEPEVHHHQADHDRQHRQARTPSDVLLSWCGLIRSATMLATTAWRRTVVEEVHRPQRTGHRRRATNQRPRVCFHRGVGLAPAAGPGRSSAPPPVGCTRPRRSGSRRRAPADSRRALLTAWTNGSPGPYRTGELAQEAYAFGRFVSRTSTSPNVAAREGCGADLTLMRPAVVDRRSGAAEARCTVTSGFARSGRRRGDGFPRDHAAREISDLGSRRRPCMLRACPRAATPTG